jgi:hypothetical protein
MGILIDYRRLRNLLQQLIELRKVTHLFQTILIAHSQCHIENNYSKARPFEFSRQNLNIKLQQL